MEAFSQNSQCIELLREVQQCTACSKILPHAVRPVVKASQDSQILVIGQAPGRKVHETGIPWNDVSGRLLRSWLDVTESTFYDTQYFALMPMGFCYPGKGKSGDLPPRPECAPLWHDRFLKAMPKIQLTLLVGQYSQRYYLGTSPQLALTNTVRGFQTHLPQYIPLPHPSPRNRKWFMVNPWFAAEVVPVLKQKVRQILERA